MKRVTIAVALFLSMLFGSTAFAGGKSANAQYDMNFISVGSGGYYRGKQYHRRPIYRHHRRAAPRRHFKAPRQIHRAPRRAMRHGQRRYYGHAPTRIIRHGQRRNFKRQMPRSRAWHHQRWQQKRRARKYH